MSPILKGLLISYAYLFGMVFLAEGIRAWKKLGSEFTRKVIHIGVGVWGLIAYWTLPVWWAAFIPPFSFILINLISYKWALFKSMEISDKSNLGTIYYPLSLCILIILFWQKGPHIVPLIGLFIMALGDGFASIIGKKWGKHPYRIWKQLKTWEGSSAMFVFSFAALLFILFTFTDLASPTIFFQAALVAFLAALAEGVSPMGIDNITVPLIGGFSYWFLFMR